MKSFCTPSFSTAHYLMKVYIFEVWRFCFLSPTKIWQNCYSFLTNIVLASMYIVLSANMISLKNDDDSEKSKFDGIWSPLISWSQKWISLIMIANYFLEILNWDRSSKLYPKIWNPWNFVAESITCKLSLLHFSVKFAAHMYMIFSWLFIINLILRLIVATWYLIFLWFFSVFCGIQVGERLYRRSYALRYLFPAKCGICCSNTKSCLQLDQYFPEFRVRFHIAFFIFYRVRNLT